VTFLRARKRRLARWATPTLPYFLLSERMVQPIS
jgi:hypothetical protein